MQETTSFQLLTTFSSLLESNKNLFRGLAVQRQEVAQQLCCCASLQRTGFCLYWADTIVFFYPYSVTKNAAIVTGRMPTIGMLSTLSRWPGNRHLHILFWLKQSKITGARWETWLGSWIEEISEKGGVFLRREREKEGERKVERSTLV